MVTTGHQKLPKMGQNSIKSSFFARRAKKASAKGRSPPQELKVGPRSGPYLLVGDKMHNWAFQIEDWGLQIGDWGIGWNWLE